MDDKFELLKNYILNLGYEIASENTEEEIILISDESKGIENLMIDCEGPILVFEQFIGNILNESMEKYKRLLMINREVIHGAFVIDASGSRLLFKDTLQTSNLDENEVEGTLNSLSAAMAKYCRDLEDICK